MARYARAAWRKRGGYEEPTLVRGRCACYSTRPTERDRIHGRTTAEQRRSSTQAPQGARVLVVEARFYDDIADDAAGRRGRARSTTAGVPRTTCVTVPGALEDPGRDRHRRSTPPSAAASPMTARSRSAASSAARPCHFEIVAERVGARADGSRRSRAACRSATAS